MGAGLLDGAAIFNGVVGGQFVHQGSLDATIEEVFNRKGGRFVKAQFKRIFLFFLLFFDVVGFRGAALHAELDFFAQNIGRSQLGIGGHNKHARNRPVGVGELHNLGALRGDAHAGVNHVDLLGEQGGDDAVPCHGLVNHFKSHGLGYPVHGIHVKTSGLASFFIHVGKGRIVGVNAVHIGLFGKCGHGGQHGGQQGADDKLLHVQFPPRKGQNGHAPTLPPGAAGAHTCAVGIYYQRRAATAKQGLSVTEGGL